MAYLSFGRILFLGAGLLLLHACAPVPKHDLAETSTTASSDSTVNDALYQGGFTEGDWPTPEWWKSFEDPVLTHLIESALKLSPTLKRAEERLKAAYQIAMQKRAKLFPELDFEAQTNWQHFAKNGFFRALAPNIPATINDINLDLNFMYEFDFWGKNRDIFRSAMGQADAAAAERMQAELILTTSIAYAYAELQFLLRKKQILRQMVFNDQEITASRQKRENFAVDSDVPRLDALADTLDAQAQIAEVDQEIEEHIHKLKALSGLGQDAELEITFRKLPPLALTLPENLSLDLIARRPDLAAQKARIESAAKLIGAAKTDFYPNVNLMGFVGLESIFWSKLFRRENYSGSLNPAIHLPIFTAGRLRAQLREKVADFNEAVFAYNELILQAAQQVADYVSDIILLGKQLEMRKNSYEAIDHAVKHIQRRYDNALEDRVSLYSARNKALLKELMVIEVEYGKELSGILLIRALGGGFHG